MSSISNSSFAAKSLSWPQADEPRLSCTEVNSPQRLAWLRRPWVFRIVILLIGLVYLASISPNWYPTSDSALYLMLGDNLADGEGYTLWGKPHVHVPPGFPLLLAGLQLIGIDSYVAMNSIMVMLALCALTCCYYALREMVSPIFAKCLFCLVAFSHVTHHTSVCLLSDIPFMCIVWLGLWCQLHGLRTGKWTLETGSILLLLSCCIRIVGVPIAMGAAVGLLLQATSISRRRIWANTGGTMLLILMTTLTAVVYVFFKEHSNALPSYLGSLSKYGAKFWESGFAQPIWNFVETAPELSTLLTGQEHPALGYVVVLLWLPIIVGAVTCWRRGQRFGVSVIACYLMSLLLFKPLVARYLLPVSPLILWYFIEGMRWLSERRPQWQARGVRVAVTCALLMLAFNVPKAVKLAYRLHFPTTDNSYRQYQSIVETARYLKATAKPGELFVTNKDERILAYLSGVWTVPLAEWKISHRLMSRKKLKAILKPEVRFVVIRNVGKKRNLDRLRQAVFDYGSSLEYSSSASEVYTLNEATHSHIRSAAKIPIVNTTWQWR